MGSRVGCWLLLVIGALWVVPAWAADEAPLPADVTSAQLPTDAELADCWARVILRANPGPLHYLAYEVTGRGPAGVVSHVRGFMGRGDVITRTELIPKSDLRRLIGYLRDLGALQFPHFPALAPKPDSPVPPVAAKAGRARKGSKKQATVGVMEAGTDPAFGPSRSADPIFELSFRVGGVENTLLVAAPLTLPDRRYARFIEVLRAVALRVTGEIGYHGPLGAGGEVGYLFIDSVPSAEVIVDGVPLGESTPILAYSVAPGAHTVVLENKRLGLRRETRVRVQAGLTTSVELELQ